MQTADSQPAAASRLEEFNHYFELSLAMTRKQRADVYQMRYRVYCEEFGYEPTEEFTNHQEIDEFDCQSIHCLVTHRASGSPAGCVRVVTVEGSDIMPMEAHAGDSVDRHFMDSFSDRRETLCEISRLAVDGAFRRRRRERQARFGSIDAIDFSQWERRTFPLIALALILGAGAVAHILDRKNCFAIIEPSLSVMLKRTGIDFRRVGPDFEFRGLRAPYYGNMDELIGSAPTELHQYFQTLRQEFAKTLLAVPKMSASSESEFPAAAGRRPPWWPFTGTTGEHLLEYSRRLVSPGSLRDSLPPGSAW